MNKISFSLVAGWIYGLILVIIGVLNLLLVHPVPGSAYLLISLIFIPPVNEWLLKRFGIRIPGVVKIILGVIIMMFTLGVSDLAEMYHI